MGLCDPTRAGWRGAVGVATPQCRVQSRVIEAPFRRPNTMFSAFCKLRQAVARIASADPETLMRERFGEAPESAPRDS